MKTHASMSLANDQRASPSGATAIDISTSMALHSDSIQAISLSLNQLRTAADRLMGAMNEILTVTAFCSDVKKASLALSIMAVDYKSIPEGIEQLSEDLHRDVQQSLGALSRTGKHTSAATNAIEQAATMLQQLAARLAAERVSAVEGGALEATISSCHSADQ